jgi:hypothetical protein
MVPVKTPGKSRKVSAEMIARKAERGEDVSRFFTNTGHVMPAHPPRFEQVSPITVDKKSPL